MSDVEVAEKRGDGEILIKITEDRITYDSEFSLIEVVFWLDTVRAMLIKKVIEE